MSAWTEIGDRVFVRRYAFYDQNIGVILGDDGVLVIDTRVSLRQAREIRVEPRTNGRPQRLISETYRYDLPARAQIATLQHDLSCCRLVGRSQRSPGIEIRRRRDRADHHNRADHSRSPPENPQARASHGHQGYAES